MKADFQAALRLAQAGQAPTPGVVLAPGGIHEQLLASVAAREGQGQGQGASTIPTVTPAGAAGAGAVAGRAQVGRPRPAFTPVTSKLAEAGESLGARARRARFPSRRGTSIEEALGEAPGPAHDPSQPTAPALGADVVPGQARDLRAGDGEPAPEEARDDRPRGARVDVPVGVAGGAVDGPDVVADAGRPPLAEHEARAEAALATTPRWPEGHPGFKVCPVCDGSGQLDAGSKGQVPCGRCGGAGEVPQVQLGKPYAVVTHPVADRVEAALAKEVDQPLPGLEVDSPEQEVPDAVATPGAAHGREPGAASLYGCPEHAEFQPWCMECAASIGADPVNPHWTPEQVYAYVEGFNDSPEGPVRFPGSIAESSQGPDPRYQPWMDACLPLAKADALGDPVFTPAAAPGLTYDLPTDLYALPPFCYVAGPAGTGKTFQAKAWAASDPEGVVLAATTGIAAVNLGEGCTINSLFKYYNTASLMEAFTGGWLEAQLTKLRRAGLRRVVLDEVSMLDGDQLTILSRAFDNVNSSRGAEDPEVGLVLVGDFAQLPPVKASYAFESAEWDRYAQATYKLTTIRRQADRAFVEALQAVRRGDHEAALAFFGPRLEATTHPTFEGTTILAKNEAVDKYNQLRLDKVAGQALAYPSSRWGKLRPEWGGKPKPVAEWGVPEVLKLKVGALVMVLANRNVADKGEAPEYLYVNGDLGVIEPGGQTGCCLVRLQRTGEVVQVDPITRENTIPLEPGRRKALRAEGHPERISANGKQEVVGAVSYLPLRLAWGTTVHKSQGLSLDTVQVNMRDPFFASPSMLYVALSRARTAEGLRLVGTPEGFRARCKVAEKVRGWL